MEFHEKLQELRKQKGLTQEELAQLLFVSRTAVSKWESGRGYPNIDSLKAISKVFAVSIDGLLSGEELLTIAEDDSRQKERLLRDLVLGLLDCSMVMFFFLPFFGQHSGGEIQAVSLLGLTMLSGWLKWIYLGLVAALTVCGVATLALQNLELPRWRAYRDGVSLGIHALGVVFFIMGQQPYAAVFLFLILAIKAVILTKKS